MIDQIVRCEHVAGYSYPKSKTCPAEARWLEDGRRPRCDAHADRFTALTEIKGSGARPLGR